MPLLKLLLAGLMFLAAGQYAAGQQPLLRHYTVKDGLPSNVVYDIYEDSRGFIWFCTDHGVSRYDGSEFEIYSIRNGLPDTEVFRIREDGQHRFWLICFNRKACYIQNGKVYNSTNDSMCRAFEQIGFRYDEIFVDRKGTYCLVGNKIVELDSRSPGFHIRPGDSLREGRALYFRTEKKEYIFSSNTLYDLTDNIVSEITSLGTYEACYYKGSLFLFRGPDGHFQIEEWQEEQGIFRLSKTAKGPGPVLGVYVLGTGTLLLCTETGLWHYNISGGVLEREYGFPLSIRSNRMLRDKEGNMWIGTLNDGVYIKVQHSGRIIDRNSGLSRNNILSLSMFQDSTLAAGGDKGDIYLIGKDKLQMFVANDSGMHNRVLFVSDVGRNTLIAGSDHGLFKIDKASGHSSPIYYNAFKAGLLDGKTYIAGAASVSLLFDINTGKYKELSEMRITALVKDAQGTLWAGGANGIGYYSKGQYHACTADAILSNSRVSCMSSDRQGNLVVGTSGNGLFVVRKGGASILRLEEANGLSSNNCKSLFVAEDNVVWLCTDRGVDKITVNAAGKYAVAPFPLPDIPSGNKINNILVQGRQLYLATAEGIVLIDIRDTAILAPPRLYIKSFNSSELPAGEASYFFTLPYKERNIQIGYTGVSFTGGPRLQYKYLLQGGAADTVFTEARSVDFSALSPGSYKLLLWCRRPGGLWTERPATLSFRITPPFWRHPLFVGGLVLLLATAAAGGYRKRTRSIRLRAERDARNRQQVAELEVKALRAQINPHFIFNALNSIQSYYSQNDELKANHYMTSFARFIRLTLMHSQSHWLPLNEELDMLRTYIELEQMRFKQLFSFTIEVSPDIDPKALSVPAMLIQPYVENAINHGLRHIKGRAGILSLKFIKEENTLLCIVSDNGVGIRQAEAGKPVQHTSFGMNINRQRINAINRMYDMDIELEVLDQSTLSGNTSGTMIILHIPIRKITSL